MIGCGINVRELPTTEVGLGGIRQSALAARLFRRTVCCELDDGAPFCASPMKEKLAAIQAALRANPAAIDRMREEVTKGAMDGIYDMDRLRATAETTIRDVNAFMQGMRVLCVTTRKDSYKMWSGYAENHKGIALRKAA
jgi:hypothetical protein